MCQAPSRWRKIVKQSKCHAFHQWKVAILVKNHKKRKIYHRLVWRIFFFFLSVLLLSVCLYFSICSNGCTSLPWMYWMLNQRWVSSRPLTVWLWEGHQAVMEYHPTWSSTTRQPHCSCCMKSSGNVGIWGMSRWLPSIKTRMGEASATTIEGSLSSVLLTKYTHESEHVYLEL